MLSLVVLSALLLSSSSFTLSPKPSLLPSTRASTTTSLSSVSRSNFLRSAVAAASPLLLVTALSPLPSFAGSSADLESLRESSAALKALSIPSFVKSLAAGDSTTKLPAQVPIVVFQRLAKVAHDTNVDGGAFAAGDFEYVAKDYAVAAGAARDFYKLSRLGREGENGSEAVAKDYAEKCGDQLEAAGVLLNVLVEAVK